MKMYRNGNGAPEKPAILLAMKQGLKDNSPSVAQV
jgi:hypothetical protein